MPAQVSDFPQQPGKVVTGMGDEVLVRRGRSGQLNVGDGCADKAGTAGVIATLDEGRPWRGRRLPDPGLDKVKLFVGDALEYARAHDDPGSRMLGLIVVGVNSISACCDVMPDNVA
jgi:hypothetical protein